MAASRPIKRARYTAGDEEGDDDVSMTAILTGAQGMDADDDGAEMALGPGADLEAVALNTAKFERPAVRINPETQSVDFQQLEADFYIGDSIQIVNGRPVQTRQKRAIIRMFGVTKQGNSVMALFHNYQPYFYVATWHGFGQHHLDALGDTLNSEIASNSRGSNVCEKYVVRMEVEKKQSLWGYHFNELSNFVKITVCLPQQVATARRILERGVNILGEHKSFSTYESNVPFVLRYMADKDIRGGGWVSLPAKQYALIEDQRKSSSCQIELVADARSVIAHDSVGEWLEIAPLRILSFDIECAGRKGHFPQPEYDSVITIGCCLSIYGKPDDFQETVFTLGTCASIIGVSVVQCTDEVDLLMKFLKYFTFVDSDIITGYNVINFDLNYLINRAKAVGAKQFPYLGRIKGSLSTIKHTTFTSKAFGTRESKEIKIEGRVQFDVLEVIRREYKLRSYTLNSVSAHFLNQQKEDVHHSIITDLQNGSDETRRRLAVYCLKDAKLPLLLMHKLLLVVNSVEMARVTGVPIAYLLTRGQQIKVVSQLLRKARQHNFVIPVRDSRANEGQYEGATVLEPKCGYYSQPIATLDFASLYPSIMIAHNLCIDADSSVTYGGMYARRIIDMQQSLFQRVLAHSHREQGAVLAIAKKWMLQGVKDTMKLIMIDGRSLICTPDHQILTVSASLPRPHWQRADALELNSNRLLASVDGPLDKPFEDPLERDWHLNAGPFNLSCSNFAERERALAFARLVGYALTKSECTVDDTLQVKTNSAYVVEMLQEDQKLLFAESNTIGSAIWEISACCGRLCRLNFDVVISKAILMISSLDCQGIHVPQFLLDPACPLSIVREFIAALLGATAEQQSISVTSQSAKYSARHQFGPIISSLKHSIPHLTWCMQVAALLQRLGITVRVLGNQNSVIFGECPRTLRSFHSTVGFRYAPHLSCRLSVAAAWASMQAVTVEQVRRVLTKSTVSINLRCENSFLSAVHNALDQISLEGPLFCKSTFKDASFQQLCEFQQFDESGWLNLCSVVVDHPMFAYLPDAWEWLRLVRADGWFSAQADQQPLAKRFCARQHLHAWSAFQNTEVLPYFELPVVGKCFEGKRTVLDLSIAMHHSFIAQGVIVHNCYTTMISRDDAKRLPDDEYARTPNGDYFVKASQRKGLLPEILLELLSARKMARAQQKEATDPFVAAVLNGRQLALKISANSVYGFTGAQVGQLPCLPISSSVTAYGRTMIEHTKAAVESHFNIQNGYTHDAEVIYGDTDSVMVRFGVETVDDAIKLGAEAANYVNKDFIQPIKLEFEKVYFPYLLMNKKRYAGMYWSNSNKPDKLDAKGIETVRRDNCALVSNVLDECLNLLMEGTRLSLDKAIEHAKSVIQDLLLNRVDLSMLVVSKALSKADYAGKQAHVELAERMRKRDPASAPAVGDRVAYVITKSSKDAKAWEKAEDPLYVLENDVPIDTHYYLTNQLQQPLTRLFEPIIGAEKTASLFAGDHTRKIKMSAPTMSSGIMKFAVKKRSCVGCKVLLSDKDGALCQHCASKQVELYIRSVEASREHEEAFNKLWTQCQRCQGSLHQDVLCSAKDCPIFYRRRKAQKDLAEALASIEKFHF